MKIDIAAYRRILYTFYYVPALPRRPPHHIPLMTNLTILMRTRAQFTFCVRGKFEPKLCCGRFVATRRVEIIIKYCTTFIISSEQLIARVYEYYKIV